MLQKFNYFGQHEEYNIRLCNPNKQEICLLNFGYTKELSLRFNEMSEFVITIPYMYNNVKFEYYNMVQSKRLILIDGIGYFLITDVQENDNGIVREKVVTSYSLETELAFKKINIFDGTYKFYDPLNTANTLIGKILENTNWKIGTIDSNLWNIYRTFEIPDSTVYEFLMNDVENTYECVFIFNTFERTVSAYSLSSIVKDTDIILSYKNLIQNIEVTEKSDEIVTALSVYGSNDLGISVVNPLATNTIYDFSYFLNTDWMDSSLVSAIKLWNQKIIDNQGNYANILTQYKGATTTLIQQKSDLENLKTSRDAIEGVVKVMIQGEQKNTPEYRAKVDELDRANSSIAAQEKRIASTQEYLEILKERLKNISDSLSFQNNFTEEQYEELKIYMIENTYQNESFTITTKMTDTEIQDMAQQLYNQSVEVLHRVAYPRFEFSVDSVNFLFLKEFIDFSSQLELGCAINIEKDEGIYLKPILLEIKLQLDDPTNFSLTFGNRFKLDSQEYAFRDLFGDSIKAGSSVKFDGAKWSEYVNSGMNNTVTEFINSALDTSKNNVINATNQEIVINQNGLRGRTLLDTGSYSPKQVWLTSNTLAFTRDNWQTASLALGEIQYNGLDAYGLVADVIVGKLVAGNQLQITNDNNNFILDENGAVLNNASFSLVTSNTNSEITLNPSTGIKIRTRSSSASGWSDKFYIGTDGNLIIDGKITANSGTIGGWQIGTDRLYNTSNGDYIGSNGNGKLSLLTWTPSSARFDGQIYASNLGDQITTGNIANGSVTAAKLDTVYATKVYADEINANKVSAGWVTANFATIGELNAANANINNLSANKLDTSLITNSGGNLSIYANFLNARNGVFTPFVRANTFVLESGVNQYNLSTMIAVRTTTGGVAYCLGYR